MFSSKTKFILEERDHKKWHLQSSVRRPHEQGNKTAILLYVQNLDKYHESIQTFTIRKTDVYVMKFG